MRDAGVFLTLVCHRCDGDAEMYLDAQQLKRAEEAVLQLGVSFDDRGMVAAASIVDALEQEAVVCADCAAATRS